MREIGVFCGTFNPMHWGHLMLAEFARDQHKLEKVIVVTSANPPHRHEDLLDAEQRHLLVEAACRDNPYFQASRIELDRSGPSYTVDTLRKIRHEQNGNEIRLNLIVGQDNLPYLKEWHEAEELFALCRILVATRTSTVSKEEVSKELPEASSFELIDFPKVPVSSSLIRERIRLGKTIMYLVPPQVAKIIEARSFFKL
ncbi:MAG: nicotinate-nucleotide adenylyltransferase, partial [Candidatus Obscuribacterales bacterium]|nr:nicotinate-nucleotide adenylyltransferase [Candidatus Obscuribacterales bacterium]